MPVPIDRFIAAHDPAWKRLESLVTTARRRPAALAPGEVDELVSLYHAASTHLAIARNHYRDPALLAQLNRLVASSSSALYGARDRRGRGLQRFFAASFPAAVWQSRHFVAASAACLFVPMLAIGAWLATSDAALDVAVPAEAQDALLASEFEDYYASAPAAQFSTEVLVNNIQVSILAFALGIAGCVLTALLLAYNGANIGVMAGLFVAEGEAGKFFGLILPHGLLELTAVVVAAAAGLRVGWSLLVPGDRTRGQAVSEEGIRSVVVVLGCALAFVIAGLIEGFVTPSDLPVPLRVAIGVAAEAVFVAWIVARGPAATAAGFTGLPADDAGAWARLRDDPHSLPEALARR